MRIFLFILISTFLVCCSKYEYSDLPSVGDPLPDSVVYNDQAFYFPSSQDSIYVYKFLFKGIQFYLTAGKDKVISSMITDDSNFVTPEGIRIGENGVKVRQIGKLVVKDSKMCVYELPSKWQVVLQKLDTLSIDGTYNFFNNPERMIVITIGK